ncbi:MAG: PAS domain-containing protein, partial [Clostridiaceae bacterium]
IVNNIKSAADKLILEQYSPATVLVNTKGDILYISGRIGKYLEMAPGNVNWNIFAMARDGLYYELNNAFFKVLNKKEDVTLTNAVVKNEGGSQMVDISIKMLKEPEELCGMIMIVFTDAAPASLFQTTDFPAPIPVGSGKEKELEHELIQTRQMWQAANTELQLCKEEFKTRTEEFQSINEEFQSTNEELSTTKEELHSLNEQLKSVNLELENKLNTLIFANEDMKNQMNSMKIAAIFLDNNLCIKFFTSEMTEISRLISSDVGRPFTDIASDLIYPELTEDVAKVMESLVLVEKHVISNNGSWYNIRILPYRKLDDKIDGVVITYVNITNLKVLGEDLRKRIVVLEEQIADKVVLDGIQQSYGEIAASKYPKV